MAPGALVAAAGRARRAPVPPEPRKPAAPVGPRAGSAAAPAKSARQTARTAAALSGRNGVRREPRVSPAAETSAARQSLRAKIDQEHRAPAQMLREIAAGDR